MESQFGTKKVSVHDAIVFTCHNLRKLPLGVTIVHVFMTVYVQYHAGKWA